MQSRFNAQQESESLRSCHFKHMSWPNLGPTVTILYSCMPPPIAVRQEINRMSVVQEHHAAICLLKNIPYYSINKHILWSRCRLSVFQIYPFWWVRADRKTLSQMLNNGKFSRIHRLIIYLMHPYYIPLLVFIYYLC